MLRSMCGIQLRDRMNSEEVLERYKLAGVEMVLRNKTILVLKCAAKE